MTSRLREPPPWGAVIFAMTVPSMVRFCAAATVKVCAGDVPPPGAGVKTVTWAVPGAAVSAARSVAVNRVALTKVVVRSVPFQRTCEPVIKFEPLTVSAKPAPPAVALAGASKDKAGAGLLDAGALVTVNVCWADIPPPGVGVSTLICAVPAA